jgi:5-methyltetrahydropteroyltriglutamate--homocysteine methyltransferase
MKAMNGGAFPWRGTPLEAEFEAARAQADPAAARAVRDRLTRQAVGAQAAVGLDRFPDGLARRDEPVAEVAARLRNVETGPWKDGYPGGQRYRVPIVRGEVSWKEPILVEDYLFAATGAPAPINVVLTGPFTVAQLAEDHAYGDPMGLAMALATAFNQELRGLQENGATFVQVDEPLLLASPDAFPIFTRVWEVLGRGVRATLALHLEGGLLAPVAEGVGRLKRLGCLSVDCVAHPDNLAVAIAAPLPETTLLALGMAGREPVDAEAIAARLGTAGPLPPDARLVLTTACDFGGLAPAEAAARLGALAAARKALTPA